MKALVVFFDPPNARYQWLLKPGFRHVFACVLNGDYWIMNDPRDGRPVLQVAGLADYDLKEYFELQGYTVVETEQGDVPTGAPMTVNDCVGSVKALLCIRAPLVQTPYGLYKYLIRGKHAHS